MTTPRLSDFIRVNMEEILLAWENFARTVEPPALGMDDLELRDHAHLMLSAIADDLDVHQTDHQRRVKSEGKAPVAREDTPAELHAEARLLAGYTAVQLVSEYRALRSSVLWLWSRDRTTVHSADLDDMTRFNEGIDQALAESVARYEKLVTESRDMFLAILGHDLRNPLSTVVHGSTLIMRAEDVAKKYSTAASRIFHSARRMSSLVTDLIEFTRTHLGAGIPVRVTDVDVIAVCHEVIDELTTAHPTRLISFQAPSKLIAKLDHARIAQMISNLIGNALQYGESASPIIVEVKCSADNLLMDFNNRGVPIPLDKISSIFDPLVRLEKANVVSGGNLGIGLFIARETVLAHGGKISVTSNASDGTTFKVTIPLQPSV